MGDPKVTFPDDLGSIFPTKSSSPTPAKAQVVSTPPVELSYCTNEPKHQKHEIYTNPFSSGYRCADVISMEKEFGRHNEACKWVGYIAATKCGCIK